MYKNEKTKKEKMPVDFTKSIWNNRMGIYNFSWGMLLGFSYWHKLDWNVFNFVWNIYSHNTPNSGFDYKSR